jgi:peptidoglycan/xylan/chitin deacetylase (PgdA/CDA1 family)
MSWDILRWGTNCGLRVADQAGVLKRLRTQSSPIVLMYHGIPRRKPSAIGITAVDRDAFARHMRYLKHNFRIVHPDDFQHYSQPPSSKGKPSVVLTFDDGFANNARIVRPILEELQIAALFFVSTRHLEPGRYLWFIHARALFTLWPGNRIQLLGRTWKLGLPAARQQALWAFMKEARSASIEEIYRGLSYYPVEAFVAPEVIEEELRGMSKKEVAAISKSHMIVIGSHTCNHPYLTVCTTSQLAEEILGAKATLDRICGRAITTFAYPAGDYDVRVASAITRAGFALAFAVNPHTQVTEAGMAIPRTGIYAAGLGILAAKSYGLFSGYYRSQQLTVKPQSVTAVAALDTATVTESRSSTKELVP